MRISPLAGCKSTHDTMLETRSNHRVQQSGRRAGLSPKIKDPAAGRVTGELVVEQPRFDGPLVKALWEPGNQLPIFIFAQYLERQPGPGGLALNDIDQLACGPRPRNRPPPE